MKGVENGGLGRVLLGDLATALYPECRSRMQEEEVRESVHCDFVFVLSEGIGHSRKD